MTIAAGDHVDHGSTRGAVVLTVQTLTTGGRWAHLRLPSGKTAVAPVRELTPAPVTIQPTFDL